MKSVLFENMFTHEQVECQDTTKIKQIDGVDYLTVNLTNVTQAMGQRDFLVRKDALKVIKKQSVK